MENRSPQHNKHKVIAVTRFKQTIWITILLIVIGVISGFFLKIPNNSLLVLGIDFIAMFSLFPMVLRNKLEIAKQVYLWINLFVASYLIWNSGSSISSSFILLFPVFLLVSALIASSKTFFCVFTFIVTLVATAGVATINGWNPNIPSELGYWQIIVVLLLLSVSAYTAWRFDKDMKFAVNKLKIEVQNVNNSRSEIERLIHFDSLTGLSSRLHCEDKYKEFKDHTDKSTQQISFLLLDIDNFKFINDNYNHATGDEFLKKMALNLKELIQIDDIACRLGGDGFLLIISRPKEYNLVEFTKNVLQIASKPIAVFDHMLETTLSAGIALVESSSESFEEMLKKADLAMYKAKELGKNQSYFYDEEILKRKNRKLQIVNGLKEAILNDDLELFLQPKIDLENGKIHSAEALLRWVNNNPDNISPAEFIPLIESTDLICDIGEWVIIEACRLCKYLHNNGFEDLSISVNISSAQFMRGGLQDIIINALEKSQLSPKFLELELTEHILFKDDADILEELNQLKELGLSLSIDDFGTGYSNLSYLNKFKVDSLKIDQSFIKNIHLLPDNLAIVDAIIKMGKSLGLTIIAEGVETKKEWSELNKLNCDFGQGYLWSKPINAKDFLKFSYEAK